MNDTQPDVEPRLTGRRVTSVKRDLGQGMPTRLRARYRRTRRRKWWRALRIAILSIGAFVLFSVLRELIGEGVKSLRDDVWAWIEASPKDNRWKNLRSSNGVGLIGLMGWILLAISIAGACLLYVTARGRAGEILVLKEQNGKLNTDKDMLTKQTAQLELEVENVNVLASEYLAQLAEVNKDLELRREEARFAHALNVIDIFHANLLGRPHLEPKQVDLFFFTAFRSMFGVFSTVPVRACVYIPDPSDPDWLIISEWETVGGESRERNRYYIGTDDPIGEKQRGIPGKVFYDNQGTAIADVLNHPFYYDVYRGHRPSDSIPYKSAVYAPIPCPQLQVDNSQRPLGVLVFDSLLYEFSPHDLVLAEPIALRIGMVLEQWRHSAKGELAAEEGGGSQ